MTDQTTTTPTLSIDELIAVVVNDNAGRPPPDFVAQLQNHPKPLVMLASLRAIKARIERLEGAIKELIAYGVEPHVEAGLCAVLADEKSISKTQELK